MTVEVGLSEVKLLREPLVQFMFIGAVIYLLYGVFAEPALEADDKAIVVTAGEVEWMRTAWQKRWRRPPTTAEFDGLMQQYIRETVLYREALTMGLNKHDQVIRRRLAQKLELLARDLVALTPPAKMTCSATSISTKSATSSPPSTLSPRSLSIPTSAAMRPWMTPKKSRRS